MAPVTTIAPAVASPESVPETEVSSIRYTVFRRQRQLFGLSIDLVREVLAGQPLTRVPRAQTQLLGVMSLRGEILPVVVIDGWLGLPSIPDDPSQPILVVRRADLLVGFRVDGVQSVLRVPRAEVQPHPSAGHQQHLAGIWHPEGLHPITLIAGAALLETLCRQAATIVN